MLATLTDRPFSDPNWIFERKLDGERVLGFRSGRQVTLVSRNQKVLNGNYPELVEALAAQPEDRFIVDGEVVGFAGRQTSFSRLQQRMQLRDPEAALHTGVAVYYYLFDLLYLDGYDLTGLELGYRKRLLKEALRFDDPLRYSAHRARQGETFYKEACRRGWEGLIAKRLNSRYVHRRSTDWLKFKCVAQQEVVIGGYTEPKGSRVGFGALLVGYYRDGTLVYAGKVGTGYDTSTLRVLGKRLEDLRRTDSPFDRVLGMPLRGVHWVDPVLVAEVGFTEWTRDGRLRHPRFLGLRRDKDPREVVREAHS